MRYDRCDHSGCWENKPAAFGDVLVKVGEIARKTDFGGNVGSAAHPESASDCGALGTDFVVGSFEPTIPMEALIRHPCQFGEMHQNGCVQRLVRYKAPLLGVASASAASLCATFLVPVEHCRRALKYPAEV